MALTLKAAMEDYQAAYDILTELAEDYEAAPDVTDIASAAANEIEVQYIEEEAEDEDELEDQYADFIDYLESVIEDLEDNELEGRPLNQLKKCLTKARKRFA